jgi:DnaJ-class molecular chaperone
MAGAVPLTAPPPAAFAAPSAAGSLYEALCVRRAATQAEIKAAYRAMAKRLHPDASWSSRAAAGSSVSGAAAAFMEIRRAYETLSDPAERARYDRSLGVVGAMRVRRWETDQCW